MYSFLTWPEQPPQDERGGRGPVPAALIDRTRAPGRSGIGNVLAWRIFARLVSFETWCTIHLPPISTGQRYACVVCTPPPGPPVEVESKVWPAYIDELRNLLERSRRTPRRRVKRHIERSIEDYLRTELTEQIREIQRRAPRASPPRPLGIDAPAMDADLWDAAPYLATRAARALQQGPWWWANPYRWTLQEHLQFAAQTLWAVRVARLLDTGRTLARHAGALDWTMARVPYRVDPDTRSLIRGLGLDPAEQHGLPLSYNPITVPLSDYLAHALPTIVPQIGAYLADLPPGPESLLLSSLLHHIAEETTAELSDDETPWTYHWPPEERVLLSMAHWDIWPEGDTPRDRLAALLGVAAARLHPDDDDVLRPDDLRALMRAAGVVSVGPRAV